MKPRKPTTADLNLPPLCKPRPLQAPTELLQRIEMMWKLFCEDSVREHHYWTEQHLSRRARETGKARHHFDAASEWKRQIDQLVAQAEEDDEALFELLRLDPRYLATDLVSAKVMLWQLQVLLGKRRCAEKRSFAVRAGEAKKKLQQLGKALSFETGKGADSWFSPFDLLNQYNLVRDRVERASELIAGPSSMREPRAIIKKTRLPKGCESAIRDLIAKPSSTAPVTRQVLAVYYGVSVATLDRHLAKANKLCSEPVSEFRTETALLRE